MTDNQKNKLIEALAYKVCDEVCSDCPHTDDKCPGCVYFSSATLIEDTKKILNIV